MRSSVILRCAVLALIAVLAIDATCCCDDLEVTQSLKSVAVTSANDSGGGATPLDCHACICSGLALVQTTRPHAPLIQRTLIIVPEAAHRVNRVESIDTPPH